MSLCFVGLWPPCLSIAVNLAGSHPKLANGIKSLGTGAIVLISLQITQVVNFDFHTKSLLKTWKSWLYHLLEQMSAILVFREPHAYKYRKNKKRPTNNQFNSIKDQKPASFWPLVWCVSASYFKASYFGELFLCKLDDLKQWLLVLFSLRYQLGILLLTLKRADIWF